MNRVLADTLGFLNALLAIAIVLICALAGYRSPGLGGAGLLLGAVGGLLLASVVCGLIAYVALIERHLAALVRHQRPIPAPISNVSGSKEPLFKD